MRLMPLQFVSNQIFVVPPSRGSSIDFSLCPIEIRGIKGCRHRLKSMLLPFEDELRTIVPDPYSNN